MSKFNTLHNSFWSNVNEAMYAVLAEQLGVSVQALRDLQVGWVPAVTFKKGHTAYGYWSFPMRDSAGDITGFALRDREGYKVNYPGSSGGCFYAINPKHRKGDHGYSAGKHNWVRTADAQEVCPICGKPDGCLLSAENPLDPKAVICIRKTSPKPMSFGYLHVRKPEGDLSGEALLAGDGPVLCVEGGSDTAAAAALGLTAIGRPSSTSGKDIVCAVARGRRLIVIGENDRKSDGKWPGKDGAIAMYQTARKAGLNVRMIMPPEAAKDLRAWVVVNGLTRESFDAYVEADKSEEAVALVIPSKAPLELAKSFIKDQYTIDHRTLVKRWEDAWYTYDETLGRYDATPEATLRNDAYQWSDGRQYEEVSSKGDVNLKPIEMSAGLWNSVQQGIGSIPDVTLRVETTPVWINGKKGPDPKDLVVFRNGILDVPAHTGGSSDALLETTPDLFTVTALPIPYNPAASCPTWGTFLQSSLGDEPAKVELLQEWFGYCLVPDTSRQKMMYFRGESGSGKGTILSTLQYLVGSRQYASTSLSQLAESFGLSPLVGKLVCIIGDARVSRNTDAMRGLEVLLGLTGGDAMQVNRKFKDQLEGSHLMARITIASNDFLDVPDTAGAMLRRLLVLQFNRKPANPDIGLARRLAGEVEGIAIWSLIGLKRLLDQGDFTLPPSSVEALNEWTRDTNPMEAWLQDCTLPKPMVICSKEELFDCWSKWAKETARSTWTRSVFLRRLIANAPYASDVGAGIKGIDLTPFASRRYLGKP